MIAAKTRSWRTDFPVSFASAEILALQESLLQAGFAYIATPTRQSTTFPRHRLPLNIVAMIKRLQRHNSREEDS